MRRRQATINSAARAQQDVYRLVDVRDKYRCRACEASASPRALHELQRGHHHHIEYRSKGGADTTANICLLCPSCHADVHEGRLTIRGNADGELKVTHK